MRRICLLCRRAARPAARRRGGPGPRPARQGTDRPDALCGRLRRRLRREREPGEAARRFPLARSTRRASSPPTPSCSPPAPRWPTSAARARSAPRCCGSGELDAEGVYRGSLWLKRRRRPHLRQPALHAALIRRRRDRAGPRRPARARPGIQRVTGRVYGDESAFDSLRGGPDSGYGVSVWVGPLSALSYNRGLFTEGGRGFQANPPGVRGRPARRRARGARDRGAAEAAGGPNPGRRDRPRERRLAADGAPDPAHQQAVGQLLRRDAPEGPRAPGRRPRDHQRRRARRRRPSRAGSARGPGSWTARGSRAATGRRRASIVRLLDGDVQARRLRPVRRLAPDRGPGRHALRPHAPRRRRSTAAAARPARSRTSAPSRATARRRAATTTPIRS